MERREFEELMIACHEVGTRFSEGIVFIGGIAVYLHAINAEATRALAAYTQDADFYISLADMGDLRDVEEVWANRSHSKHQLIKRGFEFDIYTERQSSLVVPYDAAFAASAKIGELRVASLEHLAVLKLEAYLDRRASSKGDKDAKDLYRIAAVASNQGSPLNAELMAPYLRDEHTPLLAEIYKSPVVSSLALGNAVVAKQLRTQFRGQFGSIMDAKPSVSLNAHAPKPATVRPRRG